MNADSKPEEKLSPRWDTKLTGELVTAAFGEEQWKKAHPSVRSMADRPMFCHYHYHEALDMLNAYIDSHLTEHGLLAVFEDYDNFSYLMQKIRAHIVAFVQSLHAVADTCAHMLYYSLALDAHVSPLKEREIDAKNVLKLIEGLRDGGKSEYDSLCRLFREVTNEHEFKYLNALTNTSKHRAIVRPELNEDFTGEREDRWVLYLESFNYAGHLFAKTDARKFMQTQHDRIQPLTVSIGVELNKVLEKLQSLKPKT